MKRSTTTSIGAALAALLVFSGATTAMAVDDDPNVTSEVSVVETVAEVVETPAPEQPAAPEPVVIEESVPPAEPASAPAPEPAPVEEASTNQVDQPAPTTPSPEPSDPPFPPANGVLLVAVPILGYTDPCGPDNSVYIGYEDLEGDEIYFTVGTDGRTLTVHTRDGFAFPPGYLPDGSVFVSFVYDLPPESGRPCAEEPDENITPPELEAVDGPYADDVAYDTAPVVEDERFETVVNEDGSVTLTANEGYTFDGENSYTYPAPVDQSADFVLALWMVVDSDENGDIWEQELVTSRTTDSTSLAALDSEATACGTYQVDLYGNSATTAALLEGGVLYGPGNPPEDHADIDGPTYRVFTVSDCAAPVAVVPEGPQHIDGCGIESDQVTWVNTDEYYYEETASSIDDQGNRTVTVEVFAKEGYYFAEGTKTSWDFSFTDEPCPPEKQLAVPVNPLIGVGDCEDFDVPSTPGVVYHVVVVDEGNLRTITVTATPAEGYFFEGEQKVTYVDTFDLDCGEVVPPTPTPEPTLEPTPTTQPTPTQTPAIVAPAPTRAAMERLPRTGAEQELGLVGGAALLLMAGLGLAVFGRRKSMH